MRKYRYPTLSLIFIVIAFVFEGTPVAQVIGLAALIMLLLWSIEILRGVTVVNPRYHAKLQHVLGNPTCSDEEARCNLTELKHLE